MKRLVRLALLALAACGGSKAGPTTYPPDEDPVYIDAGPDLLLPLELAAERACGCTDDGCRVAARDSLTALDELTFPRSSRRTAMLVDLARCLQPVIWEATDRVQPELEAFRARVCGCDRGDCATDVLREYVAWTEDGGTIHLVVATSQMGQWATTQMLSCADTISFDDPAYEPQERD